ncbi:MAG: hypothetical protein L0Y68_07910 [Candidatus Dadabacteria bacterium]|nr:hypothetical protein [Candidatus Dadabacteria bacterium]
MVRRYLLLLIVVVIAGTVGPISLSQQIKDKQWLSTSSSFIFHPHASDNLNKDKYAVRDQDDFTTEDYQVFDKFFLLDNSNLLTSPLNSNWGVFLDAGNSSPYVSFFSSLPLRSPPLSS